MATGQIWGGVSRRTSNHPVLTCGA